MDRRNRLYEGDAQGQPERPHQQDRRNNKLSFHQRPQLYFIFYKNEVTFFVSHFSFYNNNDPNKPKKPDKPNGSIDAMTP